MTTDYPKMNKEIRAKWLRALRSGKYRQARGQLRKGSASEKAMCCLGVLCDLIQPKGWDRERGEWSHDGRDVAPSYGILQSARLDREAMYHLARLNDGCGTFKVKRHSFLQIAEWIKGNL